MIAISRWCDRSVKQYLGNSLDVIKAGIEKIAISIGSKIKPYLPESDAEPCTIGYETLFAGALIMIVGSAAFYKKSSR